MDGSDRTRRGADRRAGRRDESPASRARRKAPRKPSAAEGRKRGAAAQPLSDISALRFGEMVRRSRLAQGLSQDQLAEVIGRNGTTLSRAMISSIERGKHLPGLEALLALTQALFLDLTEVAEIFHRAAPADVDLTGVTYDMAMQRARERFWAGAYRDAIAQFKAARDLAMLDPIDDDPVEERRRRAKADIGVATGLRRLGVPSAARRLTEQVINDTDGLPREQAAGYLLLSALLRNEAKLRMADDAINRAAEICGDLDPLIYLQCVTNKGAVLFSREEYKAAYETFLTARRLAEEHGSSRHVVHNQINLGQALISMGKTKQARKKLQDAATLARQREMPAFEASALASLAEIEFDCEELDAAAQHARAALEISRLNRHDLTHFAAEWILHSIAIRRHPKRTDGRRLARLRQLYGRLRHLQCVRVLDQYRDQYRAERSGEVMHE